MTVEGAVRPAAGEPAQAGKPTPADLGIDLDTLAWDRSGDEDGSIEVAFPVSPRWTRGDWVLLRVAGDPAGRVLVFDRNEWDCFIDGARKGEFNDAAVSQPAEPGGHRGARPGPALPPLGSGSRCLDSSGLGAAQARIRKILQMLHQSLDL